MIWTLVIFAFGVVVGALATWILKDKAVEFLNQL